MNISTAQAAERVLSRCHELAKVTDTEGETTRTFLSPSMHRIHSLLSGWMEAAGADTRIDAAGNLRGILAGTQPNPPRLLIGSHLDTVPNAGAFDGVLGVVLGVALMEESAGEPLPFTIEVIGFSEEEGVRFGKPFLGSLALVGELDADLLARTDRDGVTVAQAIRHFGLDPAELPSAVLHSSAFGYLEFHIEQGPVLESEDQPLGVVEAIAGQTRMQFVFTGHANHAGTTPMGALRHDAVAAAAQWITEVERYANACDGLVATVGKVETIAGAGNVIAGEARATLDVRHAIDAVRKEAVQHYLEFADAAAARRSVKVAQTTSLDQSAVPMDANLSTLLAGAVTAATGRQPRLMTSGAGHDAMIVARRLPSAMLFLRSPGGLSHHPDETVLPQDAAAAIAAGLEFLRSLRDDSTILERLSGAAPGRKRSDTHA